jgi:hypothetical protein
MKTLKAIGLTALAMVAAAAILAAGTGSATTLCKENKDECPAGMRYPEKQVIEGKILFGHKFKFVVLSATKALMFEAQCEAVTLVWETTKNNGPEAVLKGTMKSLKFTQCTEGSECEAVEMLYLPYAAEVLGSVGKVGEGLLWLSNGGTGKPTIRLINCWKYGVNCNYEASGETRIWVEGAMAAQASALWKMPSEGANLLCGAEVEASGFFEFTLPKKMWAEAKP